MDIDTWIPVLYRVWRSGRRNVGVDKRTYPDEGEYSILAEGVRRLSHGFTGHRRLVGAPYMNEDRLWGAYLNYYWPLSYVQARSHLEETFKRLPRLPRNILDLGSGPGPMAYAAVDTIHALGGHVESVTFLDHGAKAVSVALNLAEEAHFLKDKGILWKGEAWQGKAETLRALPHKPKGGWDLVVLGHSYNEFTAPPRSGGAGIKAGAFLEAMAGQLASGGLLYLVEPALREQNEGLLELRDMAAQTSWRILGPCSFEGACPARAQGQTCHSQVWKPLPRTVKTLADLAGLQKDSVAMAWFAAQVPGSAPLPKAAWYRVVGEAMVNKAGRTRIMICGPRGRFSLSARPGVTEAPQGGERDFLALRRGQFIEVEEAEDREGGWGVGPSTRLRVWRT